MARRKQPIPQHFQQWSPAMKTGAGKESLDINLSGGNQFATRERANDFSRLMRSLPDPDPILRRMGKSIASLRDLLTDSHLESVWSVRCSAISGADWFIAPGEGGGTREKEAADSFSAQLKALDIPRIIEEMMDAVAYGYAPMEVLWKCDNSLWGIENIVGKPPEWFEFNPDNHLVFCGTALNVEIVPENRFLLLQHRATYSNPYGDKAFSKCFWPATFKKKGWEWWTVFVEKYGGAFTFGKYPTNAGETYKAELMDALEKMIADAVAIIPEGSEITIESLSDKGSATTVHLEYLNAANAEISKAVLGQTLTTELNGKTGSYAASQTHNEVREGLALADRSRICAAFNRLASVYTLYNFGSGVIPPKFTFVKDEDLQAERAERDMKLYTVGWRPTQSYMMRQYNMTEEDFHIISETTQEQTFRLTKPAPQFSSPAVPSCFCGCSKSKKPGVFEWFVKLFASKEERVQQKDEKLMAEFEQSQLNTGQEALNRLIEHFVDALGTVESYEEAANALIKSYDTASLDALAHGIDEIRYAAQGIGGRHG